MAHRRKSLRSRDRTTAPARAHTQDIAAFRESLWCTLDRNSAGLSGAEVVQALKTVSDEIYHAGIDEAYVRTKTRKRQNLADAWDLTWVTALSIRLWQMRMGGRVPGPDKSR